MHRPLRHSAPDAGRDHPGQESGRTSRRPLSSQCGAAAHSREEMDNGAGHDCAAGWGVAVREHLHRDVLHLHLLLGVQDLLRVRLHAPRLHHPHDCDCLCHHCGRLLPPQLRGLQMAMD